MKRLLPLIILLLLWPETFGQNWVDALRYSQTFSGGTARSTAMGGAYGALGGDFYSVSQNPAGLGVYRKSELTFSPELYYNKVIARYYGNEAEENKYNFNLNNFGLVAAYNTGNKGFIGGGFAFGYNKLNNFHRNVSIKGNNRSSSLVHSFVTSANNYEGPPKELDDLEPFTEGLFYDGGLMHYDDLWEEYYAEPEIDSILGMNNSSGMFQQNRIEESGKMNEWVFSTGFNYGHFLYFGATFSIIPVEYNSTSYFIEEDANNPDFFFFDYYESLKVSGKGYSGKFGLIVRPVSFVRIGLAYHLPVSYRLSERYEANLLSAYYEDIIYPLDYDYREFDYRINTPGKGIGSIALTFGKVAIVSADVEFINYSKMRFKPSADYDFVYENQIIKDIYRKNLNFKTGAEYRINKVYFRGGFGYYGSPYEKNEMNSDAYHLSYSAGVGFREKAFSFDLAWNYTVQDERYVLYQAENHTGNSISNLDTNITRVMATLGFRF